MIFQRPYLNASSTPSEKPASDLAQVVSAFARAVVETQQLIDQITRFNLVRWECEGIPPSGIMISSTSMKISVAGSCAGKAAHSNGAQIAVSNSVANKLSGSVAVRIRFTPCLFM